MTRPRPALTKNAYVYEELRTIASRHLVLYAVAAPGVPSIAVEEALWTAWDVLAHEH